MRIEFVLTGDELLSGQVTDTNSPWAEARLFETLGATVQEVVIVGDAREDIIEVLRTASARADVVLVSGGLGPTSDDLTAACAADAQNVPLVEDPRVLEHLRARFARGNFVLSANNLRQALVPEGAEVILNPVGSAPMFIQRLGRAWLYYVPGVPREYRALVEAIFLPRVRALVEAEGQRVHRAFRVLKVMGLAESLLDARVAPVRARHPRVQFGFRTQSPENQLKLLAEGDTQEAADAALAAAEAEVRPLLEPQLFGQDGEEFAEVVLGRLRAAGHTVAVAESCTGGMLSALLTDPAGASEVVVAGAVTYTEAAKTALADVAPELLARHGAVSREVAAAMAEGIRARWGTTWGLSVTGWAGPGGGTEADPVGTVYLGLAGADGTRVERQQVVGDRARVRAVAASLAAELLRRAL